MKLKDLKYESGAYLAFELDSNSRSKLLKKFPPSFSNVICHHVTIQFKLSEQELKDIQILLGTSPEVHVTGYCKGDGVECLTVKIGNESHRPDKKLYHITLSVEPPHKPVESNALLVSSAKIDELNPSFLVNGTYRLISK